MYLQPGKSPSLRVSSSQYLSIVSFTVYLSCSTGVPLNYQPVRVSLYFPTMSPSSFSTRFLTFWTVPCIIVLSFPPAFHICVSFLCFTCLLPMYPRVSFQCIHVSSSNVSMCFFPMSPCFFFSMCSRVSFQRFPHVSSQCLYVSSSNVSMCFFSMSPCVFF